MKYRKKPLTIEAIQYIDTNWEELLEFGNGNISILDSIPYIETLEGSMKVSINDYVIKGIRGEFYPCKLEIFKETYDALTKNSTIIIQDEIKVTQNVVDETIKYYEKMSDKMRMGWLSTTWDKHRIIKEIKELTDEGKEFILQHYEFTKWIKKEKEKLGEKNE